MARGGAPAELGRCWLLDHSRFLPANHRRIEVMLEEIFKRKCIRLALVARFLDAFRNNDGNSMVFHRCDLHWKDFFVDRGQEKLKSFTPLRDHLPN